MDNVLSDLAPQVKSVPLLPIKRGKRLGEFRMGAEDMLMNLRDCLQVRALGGTPNLKVADIEVMKIVDRIVVRECDELITMLRRIADDVATTIIEDPKAARQGWVLLSTGVLNDLQTTLHEFVPHILAARYRNGKNY